MDADFRDKGMNGWRRHTEGKGAMHEVSGRGSRTVQALTSCAALQGAISQAGMSNSMVAPETLPTPGSP